MLNDEKQDFGNVTLVLRLLSILELKNCAETETGDTYRFRYIQRRFES